MAGSMRKMEVSLKCLHSPTSDSEIQANKRCEHAVDMSDREGEELALSKKPTNADSFEGDQSAQLKQDNSSDSLLLNIEQDFSKQEDTSPPVSPKLVDINKRWSEKTRRTQVTGKER